MASKNDNNNKHLFYLNELSDYKVSSDDPDVRGWKVKDADNRVIGKVDNLLVNKNTERVVYLDVEVDSSIIEADHDPYGKSASDDVHEFINKDGENHIIIPVGLVSLNEGDDEYVYTDRVNHQTFAETKRIEKGANVNREYEVVVLNSYNRNNNNDNQNRNERRDTNLGDRDRRNEDTQRVDVRRADTDGGDIRREDRSTTSNDNAFREDERRNTGAGNDKFSGNEFDGRGNEDHYRSDRDGTGSNDDDFYERREFDGSNYRRKK